MSDHPVHEMSREVRVLLERAADSGTPLSRSEIQEELGLGSADVSAILDQLRLGGIAMEVAPGEWSGPVVVDEPERVPAQPVDEDDPPRSTSAPNSALERLAEFDQQEFVPAPGHRSGAIPMDFLSTRESVRLTRAMVDALDDEALGKLVRAGVAGADAGVMFVLGVS